MQWQARPPTFAWATRVLFDEWQHGHRRALPDLDHFIDSLEQVVRSGKPRPEPCQDGLTGSRGDGNTMFMKPADGGVPPARGRAQSSDSDFAAIAPVSPCSMARSMMMVCGQPPSSSHLSRMPHCSPELLTRPSPGSVPPRPTSLRHRPGPVRLRVLDDGEAAFSIRTNASH